MILLERVDKKKEMLRTPDKTVTKDPENPESIRYSLTIKAPCERVFAALTKSQIIDEWGAGPARVQAHRHGIYSLWDGEMFGNIYEIEPFSHLMHTLRERRWPPQYQDSLVVWQLQECERGTLLEMKHSDLPDHRIREIHKDGWGEYFLGPLKAWLEKEQRR